MGQCVCVYARSENERAESADCDWVRWWGRSMGGESGRRISGSRPTPPRQRNASDKHVVFYFHVFVKFRLKRGFYRFGRDWSRFCRLGLRDPRHSERRLFLVRNLAFLVVKLLPVLENFGSGTGSASHYGVNDVMMIYLPRVILVYDMNYEQNFDREFFLFQTFYSHVILTW